ncbi:outer membrane lipoprotein LolB [Pelomonas sp. SE-A7]|uniref:outer membrane lipoprotein LolB n=1 Tax=Pelomonas sp. SE-A7 TaxID=3054953 RepID=UPI00259C95BC|nr:outer membrane lipoprotein LolB [Pelomonas sp. SE-A7]MDM4766386.1 outer membrane lipoprotein LolB [Pelomonas sp. SE-A7]
MRRRLLTAALAAALAGCASINDKPPPLPPQADAQSFSGKLSVKVTGKDQGGNASFELTGTPRAGQLELSSPLGQLVARTRWDGQSVLLQTPREQRRYPDLDSLTYDLLGESIPVAALFDWLRGRPWPDAPSEPLAGDTPGFRQLGWTVDLAGFAEKGLIVARRSEPTEVVLRARVEPSATGQ